MKNHLQIQSWPKSIEGFPGRSAGKESSCNAGDLVSIPGLGRSPGEGKGYPLQYSGLENSMDCIVHGVQRVGHNWATFIYFKSIDVIEEKKFSGSCNIWTKLIKSGLGNFYRPNNSWKTLGKSSSLKNEE